MIDRINQIAARRFGGVGTTVGSFLRIHVWAVVFLVAISALAPSVPQNLASRRRLGPVENLTRVFSDPRAFKPSAHTKKDFHIAWIMGSEGNVYLNSFANLPSSVLESLPKIDQRNIAVDVYYLPAMRLGDAYFSLLDAIAAKPDMIVVSLNAVWVMNPVALHQWTQLDNRAALALSTKPNAWSIAASLLSPSDFAWGLAASKLKPVEERAYYNKRILRLVDHLGPLNRSKLAKVAAARKPTHDQELLASLPLEFWFSYRLHLPRETVAAGSSALSTNLDAIGPTRWAQKIDTSNHGDNPLNRALMDAIGRALRDSKIPSYVYLSQVNRDWLSTNKAIAAAVSRIEHQLEDRRGAFAAKNIRYQPKTASRFARGMQFLPGDVVHMKTDGSMGPYLAGELCRLMAQVGDASGCKVAREGNDNG